jgi:periplasmic divalent cation tolerance protein
MADDPIRFQLVLTTTDSEALAESIARVLVERRLAACVNLLGPVQSVYRWEGEVVHSEERMLIIKTRVDRFPQVAAAIRELHTYDVPEVLAIPLSAGDPRYLSWLAGCLPDADEPDPVDG